MTNGLPSTSRGSRVGSTVGSFASRRTRAGGQIHHDDAAARRLRIRDVRKARRAARQVKRARRDGCALRVRLSGTRWSADRVGRQVDGHELWPRRR